MCGGKLGTRTGKPPYHLKEERRRKEKKERRSRERKEGKKDAVEREGKGVGGNLGKEE